VVCSYTGERKETDMAKIRQKNRGHSSPPQYSAETGFAVGLLHYYRAQLLPPGKKAPRGKKLPLLERGFSGEKALPEVQREVSPIKS